MVNLVDYMEENGMAVITGADAPSQEMNGVTFTSLASPSRGSQETSVWRIEVPPGTPAAPHELTREEILVVVAGRADVQLGDDRFGAGVGDAIVVPPATTFALSNAGDEPLRAIVCLPVGGQASLGGTTFTPPWAQ
jgi:mannose-6-phosphate isomerase-like protein (cupin superfamily)